mgnify:CR=1 FL=1
MGRVGRLLAGDAAGSSSGEEEGSGSASRRSRTLSSKNVLVAGASPGARPAPMQRVAMLVGGAHGPTGRSMFTAAAVNAAQAIHAAPFLDADMAVVESLVVSAGVCYHKAMMFADILRAQRKAEALLEVVKATTSERHFFPLVRRVVAAAYHALGADRVAVFLVDAPHRELWCAASSDIEGWRISINTGLAGVAARTGESILVDDAYEDPRFDRTVDVKTGYRTKSVLCIPVTDNKGRVIAVLQALNKHSTPRSSNAARLAAYAASPGRTPTAAAAAAAVLAGGWADAPRTAGSRPRSLPVGRGGGIASLTRGEGARDGGTGGSQLLAPVTEGASAEGGSTAGTSLLAPGLAGDTGATGCFDADDEEILRACGLEIAAALKHRPMEIVLLQGEAAIGNRRARAAAPGISPVAGAKPRASLTRATTSLERLHTGESGEGAASLVTAGSNFRSGRASSSERESPTASGGVFIYPADSTLGSARFVASLASGNASGGASPSARTGATGAAAAASTTPLVSGAAGGFPVPLAAAGGSGGPPTRTPSALSAIQEHPAVGSSSSGGGGGGGGGGGRARTLSDASPPGVTTAAWSSPSSPTGAYVIPAPGGESGDEEGAQLPAAAAGAADGDGGGGGAAGTSGATAGGGPNGRRLGIQHIVSAYSVGRKLMSFISDYTTRNAHGMVAGEELEADTSSQGSDDEYELAGDSGMPQAYIHRKPSAGSGSGARERTAAAATVLRHRRIRARKAAGVTSPQRNSLPPTLGLGGVTPITSRLASGRGRGGSASSGGGSGGGGGGGVSGVSGSGGAHARGGALLQPTRGGGVRRNSGGGDGDSGGGDGDSDSGRGGDGGTPTALRTRSADEVTLGALSGRRPAAGDVGSGGGGGGGGGGVLAASSSARDARQHPLLPRSNTGLSDVSGVEVVHASSLDSFVVPARGGVLAYAGTVGSASGRGSRESGDRDSEGGDPDAINAAIAALRADARRVRGSPEAAARASRGSGSGSRRASADGASGSGGGSTGGGSGGTASGYHLDDAAGLLDDATSVPFVHSSVRVRARANSLATGDADSAPASPLLTATVAPPPLPPLASRRSRGSSGAPTSEPLDATMAGLAAGSDSDTGSHVMGSARSMLADGCSPVVHGLGVALPQVTYDAYNTPMAEGGSARGGPGFGSSALHASRGGGGDGARGNGRSSLHTRMVARLVEAQRLAGSSSPASLAPGGGGGGGSAAAATALPPSPAPLPPPPSPAPPTGAAGDGGGEGSGGGEGAALDAMLAVELAGTPPLDDWAFNVFDVPAGAMRYMVLAIIHRAGLFGEVRVDPGAVLAFADTVLAMYWPTNAFHNAYHGLHVCQATAMLLSTTEAGGAGVLPPVETLALLLAAVGHDVDHPGVTNVFLSAIEDELSLRYNDQSILENHHAAVTCSIMRNEARGSDVTAALSVPERRRMRQVVIAAILATDMSKHFGVLIPAVKSLTLPLCATTDAAGAPRPEAAVLKERDRLHEVLLHAADLSGQVTSWPVASAWSDRIVLEFRSQAQMEVAAGVPYTQHMHNIDTAADCAELQSGFCDYVLAPMWRALADVFPALSVRVAVLEANSRRYKEIIAEERAAAAAAAAAASEAEAEAALASSTGSDDAGDGDEGGAGAAATISPHDHVTGLSSPPTP